MKLTMHPITAPSTASVRPLLMLWALSLFLFVLGGCSEEIAPRGAQTYGAVGTTGLGAGGGTTGVGGAQTTTGGAAGIQCQPGFTLCNGACVNLAIDQANCGVCGTACPEGRVCNYAACSTECVAPYTECNGVCVNLSTDPVNCGACAIAPDGAVVDVACDAGIPCVGGACGCPEGTTLCNGRCVEPASDSANCGACGMVCPGAQACVAGACAGCPPGSVDCGGQCVNLESNANCGACGVACPAGTMCSPNGCIASSEPCPAGTLLCGGACVTTATNRDHCGACDTPCASTATCTNGVCACPAGQTQCGSTCVDTTQSSLNCGACDNACTVGQNCTAGACTCVDQTATLCGNTCANLQSDPDNCGACGVACTGYPCTEGECRCPEGETLCGDTCVLIESDPLNCGMCGYACPDGESCVVGNCSGSVGDSCTTDLAGGISLTEIAVYQAGKVTVMEGGNEVPGEDRDVALVAGKNSLFRAFFQLEDGWVDRVVSARLTIIDGDQVTIEELFHKQTVSGDSQESSLGTTFNIQVPGELITSTAEYFLEIVECDSPAGTQFSPRFPASEQVAIQALDLGVLRIEYIPINTNGRTASTDMARLEEYNAYMEAMYPVSGVESSVGDTMDANSNISANGGGWSQVLQQLSQRHGSDGAPGDLYYYGLLEPADSLQQYCAGGCVAGIGFVPNGGGFGGNDQIVSMGVSYGGEESALTMAHEVGHNHGREHAPCGGADGTDRNFPHPNAQIGWWGFRWPDRLFPPDEHPDIMAYCPDPWVSDYTYKGMLDRVGSVNGTLFVLNPNPVGQWQVIVESFEGLFWGVPPSEPVAAQGEPEAATIVDRDGVPLLEVTVYRSRMSHLGGAAIMVPEPRPGWHAIELAGHSALAFEGTNSSVP